MKQAPAIFGVLFMEMKNVKIHVKSFEKSGGEQSAIETVSFGLKVLKKAAANNPPSKRYRLVKWLKKTASFMFFTMKRTPLA